MENILAYDQIRLGSNLNHTPIHCIISYNLYYIFLVFYFYFILFLWLFVTPWTIHPFNSPGENTGICTVSLLQGIFPTQGSNPGLPHCRWILYQLSHKRSPRTLEWVAYAFSRGSSRPRSWTGVFFIVGEFFTNWAIREAQFLIYTVVTKMQILWSV